MSSSSRVVLIVDDSMTVRDEVRRVVASVGFDAVEAEDGASALAKAAQMEGIVLVIVDINMPVMNGLDFLAAFRSDERFKAIPAVILTTEAQPALVDRAKTLGAKGWIIKPFRPNLLAAAVSKLAMVVPVAAATAA